MQNQPDNEIFSRWISGRADQMGTYPQGNIDHQMSDNLQAQNFNYTKPEAEIDYNEPNRNFPQQQLQLNSESPFYRGMAGRFQQELEMRPQPQYLDNNYNSQELTQDQYHPPQQEQNHYVQSLDQEQPQLMSQVHQSVPFKPLIRSQVSQQQQQPITNQSQQSITNQPQQSMTNQPQQYYGQEPMDQQPKSLSLISEPFGQRLVQQHVDNNYSRQQSLDQYSADLHYSNNVNQRLDFSHSPHDSRQIDGDDLSNIEYQDDSPGQKSPGKNPLSKSSSEKDPFKQKGYCADFKQQNIEGYYFIPSSKCVIICNTILGLWLIILGSIVLGISNAVVEVDVVYSSACPVNGFCSLPVNIPTDMEAPVFVYLKMSGFYQNHRTYVKSMDRGQLSGTIKDQDALSGCEPVIKVSDLLPYQQVSLSGAAFGVNDTANPCGLQARSFITDNFFFNDPNNISITINTTDIAWSVDKNSNYKRNPLYLTTQWVDVADERFMNWMNFATIPDWKKLWGRIDEDLTAGTYYLQIENSYDVSEFGVKTFSLSTMTAIGGTSTMLGSTLLAFGVIYFLVAMAILGYRWIRRIDDHQNYKELTFDWKK